VETGIEIACFAIFPTTNSYSITATVRNQVLCPVT
jgi:hypothetical protein